MAIILNARTNYAECIICDMTEDQWAVLKTVLPIDGDISFTDFYQSVYANIKALQLAFNIYIANHAYVDAANVYQLTQLEHELDLVHDATILQVEKVEGKPSSDFLKPSIIFKYQSETYDHQINPEFLQKLMTRHVPKDTLFITAIGAVTTEDGQVLVLKVKQTSNESCLEIYYNDALIRSDIPFKVKFIS